MTLKSKKLIPCKLFKQVSPQAKWDSKKSCYGKPKCFYTFLNRDLSLTLFVQMSNTDDRSFFKLFFSKQMLKFKLDYCN